MNCSGRILRDLLRLAKSVINVTRWSGGTNQYNQNALSDMSLCRQRIESCDAESRDNEIPDKVIQSYSVVRGRIDH
jgi:hypothetical protein